MKLKDFDWTILMLVQLHAFFYKQVLKFSLIFHSYVHHRTLNIPYNNKYIRETK